MEILPYLLSVTIKSTFFLERDEHILHRRLLFLGNGQLRRLELFALQTLDIQNSCVLVAEGVGVLLYCLGFCHGVRIATSMVGPVNAHAKKLDKRDYSRYQASKFEETFVSRSELPSRLPFVHRHLPGRIRALGGELLCNIAIGQAPVRQPPCGDLLSAAGADLKPSRPPSIKQHVDDPRPHTLPAHRALGWAAQFHL